ncbi:MAG: hypothetical protein H6709_13060 [Kofleriaceae bacterium]|nr:hypothetical protein [Kofleriaceae bacterium]
MRTRATAVDGDASLAVRGDRRVLRVDGWLIGDDGARDRARGLCRCCWRRAPPASSTSAPTPPASRPPRWPSRRGPASTSSRARARSPRSRTPSPPSRPARPGAARAAAATAAPPGARGRGSLRRWLADAGRGPWDLVVLDLRTPARAEVAALASVETLRALATRLPDDGVVVLWLPLWQVDGAAIASVADAARAAFPDVTLWRGDTSRRWGTLGVAASRAALRLDPDVLARRLAAAPGAPWPRATDVAALYVGDWPARADAAPTDDDHPRLAIASARTRAGDRALVARRLVDYYRDVLVALPRRRVYDAAGWDPDAALRRQLDAAGAAGE